MQTIRLDVEDSKVDVILNIIQSLKEDIVKSYEIINHTNETKDFIDISQKSLSNIWDNEEDSEYDKYLKI